MAVGSKTAPWNGYPSHLHCCPGCKKADVCLDSCWHALSCMQLSGVPITDRHNRILMIIARFCQLILLSVRTEPGGLDHGSKKRPDLQISLPDHTLLGDVPSPTLHREPIAIWLLPRELPLSETH